MSVKAKDRFLRAAVAALQARQFSEAEQGFRLFLQHHPLHAGALNLMALALAQQDKYSEAFRFSLKALKLCPTDDVAQANHGRILRKLNRLDQSVAAFAQSLRLNPRNPEVWNDMGVVLNDLGQFQRAPGHFDKALLFNHSYYEAYYNKGNALNQLNRPEEALAAYDAAVDLQPSSYEARHNRGQILNKLGRDAEALAEYDAALALRGDDADLWSNRGHVLMCLARPVEALHACEQALALRPEEADFWVRRGIILRDLSRLEEALSAYDTALKLKPDHADAYWGRSTILLLQGRFEQGLAEYEWRSKADTGPKFDIEPRYLWLGQQDLRGKILFIHPELYLGDMLQFCRYGLLAEQEGAHVVIAAPAALHRVLRSLSPTLEWIETDARPPRFDFYCPLMSLPLAFYRRLPAFPAPIPYLSAEKARVQFWKEHIGAQGFKVGICWQGSTAAYAAALRRSFSLLQFQGLGQLPNVRLISLQKNDGLEQLANLPPSMRVETLGDEFDAGADAFLDTAAVMETLDLIITTDTAIAHLAGALGRPTWVALPDKPDWRWMLERSDSPWYPTMRLFRQTSRESWDEVFLAMEQALRDHIAHQCLSDDWS